MFQLLISLIGALVPICVEHPTAPARRRPVVLPPGVEGACQMFTAEQYRAKAAEFRALLTNTPRFAERNEGIPRSRADLHEAYEEWMAVNLDKTIQRRENYDNSAALAEEEEQILKCLGAAVLMRWNTVPTKLQRVLFDCASTIGDLQQTTPLKGRIARFLHNHKGDRQK
jgi:hypothetical protein